MGGRVEAHLIDRDGNSLPPSSGISGRVDATENGAPLAASSRPLKCGVWISHGDAVNSTELFEVILGSSSAGVTVAFGVAPIFIQIDDLSKITVKRMGSTDVEASFSGS